MKFRKWLFRIHLWAGLIVGLFIVVVTLTGSLLIFRPEIELLLYPQMYQETPGSIPLEQVYQVAHKAYPGQTVEGIITPPDRSGVYEVQVVNAEETYTYVYVDPGTGKILGGRLTGAENSWLDWFFDLHYALLLEETGSIIVGTVGVALAVMLLTGCYLWWPGLKKWVMGVKVRWSGRGWYIRHYDLHRVVGIVSLPFVLLMTCTGIAMAEWYYEWVETTWYTVTFSEHPPEVPEDLVSHPNGQPRISLDEVAARVEAAVPGATIYYIGVPADEEGYFNLWVNKPGVYDPWAESSGPGEREIDIDQYSGEILWNKDNYSPNDISLAAFLFQNNYIWHIGVYGGLTTRILHFLAGLAPAILMITGVAMWLLNQVRVWLRKRRTLEPAVAAPLTLAPSDDNPV